MLMSPSDIQLRDEATGAPVVVDTLDGNFKEDSEQLHLLSTVSIGYYNT